MDKVNLVEKFNLFTEQWSPKIVGEVNDAHVKLCRLQGEFVWHKHDHEDEMFFVVEGELLLRFRDKDVRLSPGEFLIIPKGVEHMPVSEKEVKVMLIEPKGTLNTGDVRNERTKDDLDRI